MRELLGGEIRMLQRYDAEADEPIGMRRDLLGDLLVQQLHVCRREVAVRPVVLMLEVQADHLDVDALPLHRREPALDARELSGDRRAQERADVAFGLRILLDQRINLRHEQMRVHVDRLDAAALDQRRPARRPRLRRRLRPRPAATVERDAGRRGGREKISSRFVHWVPLQAVSRKSALNSRVSSMVADRYGFGLR